MRSSCPCVGLWDELLQDAQILNVSGFGTTIFVCCDSFEGSLFVCSMQVAGYGLLCFIDVVTRWAGRDLLLRSVPYSAACASTGVPVFFA